MKITAKQFEAFRAEDGSMALPTPLVEVMLKALQYQERNDFSVQDDEDKSTRITYAKKWCKMVIEGPKQRLEDFAGV